MLLTSVSVKMAVRILCQQLCITCQGWSECWQILTWPIAKIRQFGNWEKISTKTKIQPHPAVQVQNINEEPETPVLCDTFNCPDRIYPSRNQRRSFIGLRNPSWQKERLPLFTGRAGHHHHHDAGCRTRWSPWPSAATPAARCTRSPRRGPGGCQYII